MSVTSTSERSGYIGLGNLGAADGRSGSSSGPAG